MAEFVTIPLSYFEVAVDFERTDLRLWTDRASIVQIIFDALKPWNPTVDDIELLTTGKISEQGFNFKLPPKRVSFFFGPASCRFTRDAVDWRSAEETLAILDAALSEFTRFSGIAMGAKKTAIGLHIQPKAMRFMEILNPFVPPQLATLESERVLTMATVAKWQKRKVTVDGSAVLANGIFLKLEREFESATSYEEIADQIRQDEEQLFKILGVEEDRG